VRRAEGAGGAGGGAGGGSVSLEVEDNGPGMDPATLERAGHPGFTTKSSGSGLGLTLVQRIVEQHGGRFSLTSSPGAGTRATVVLPSAPEPKAANSPAGAPKGPR
jgi:signal transduction histidine kinase